jgi:hypothetical protein
MKEDFLCTVKVHSSYTNIITNNCREISDNFFWTKPHPFLPLFWTIPSSAMANSKCLAVQYNLLQSQEIISSPSLLFFFIYFCTGTRTFKEYQALTHLSPNTAIMANMLPCLLAWCCYITVDSGTTALQNGACTYKCIYKQMHY